MLRVQKVFKNLSPGVLWGVSTLFLLGVAFFFRLGGYALLDNNEGLYASIARDMWLSGDYIIPTANGVPYIEKPPLLYILISWCYGLLGVSEFSARLIPALSGFFTCVTLVFFVKSISTWRRAFITALVLGTSVGFMVFSRMIFFDGLLTFLLTASFLSFFKWYQTAQVFFIRLSYAMLAFACLTKGFVALVLALLVVGSFFLIQKPGLSKIKAFFDPGGFFLFLALLAPWHILAVAQEEGFAWFYFVNEHILRFLGCREPVDYYSGPFYYYIPRLLIFFLPWTLVAPFVLKGSLSQKKGGHMTSKLSPLSTFLACWFAVLFIFFSFSSAKANYYVVTILPPLAIAMGQKIDELWPARKTMFWSVSAGSVLFLSIVLFVAPRYEEHYSTKPLFEKLKQLGLKKPLYLFQEYEEVSSATFYAGGTLPIIDSISRDLAYGQRKNPDNFISVQKIEKPQGLFLLRENRLQTFKQTWPELKYKVLYHAGRKLIIEAVHGNSN